jgi:hypothetical protein
MIHAGEENGFVKYTLLMWKANSNTGDYRSHFNFQNYKKLLREKLISNLLPNSVIVNNNVLYHNVFLERISSLNSRKVDMLNWLSSRRLPCSNDMFKTQLYRLIQIHKPRAQKYLAGHTAFTQTLYFASHPTSQTSIWSRWYGCKLSGG